MTDTQRITALEERVAELERARMTDEERADKERQLAALADRMTEKLYDRNPEAWKRLCARASRLEAELGL